MRKLEPWSNRPRSPCVFCLSKRYRIVARCPMGYGCLIRTKKHTTDAKGIAYIVAVAEAAEAIAIIRTRVAGSTYEIEDLGRVSEQLLATLAIPPGEFLRIDAMGPCGT
jgi:hypothetical protein